MKRSVIAAMMGVALFAGTAATAAPVLLNGSISAQRVQTLTNEITWNRSLYEAEQEARRSGKMVFWVHMLGTMTGET